MSQVQPRYIKLFNDTGLHVATRDTLTKLEHADAGSTKYMKPDEAFEAARQLDILGGGWRPPVLVDMAPIIDFSRSNPAIDLQFFPWAKPDWYYLYDNNGRCAWSSARAWYVYLYYGYVDYSHRGSRFGFAWAVRAASQ